MRILLIGKNGQIGWELQKELAGLGELTATGKNELDLCDPARIGQTLREIKPGLIINAAAYTAVANSGVNSPGVVRNERKLGTHLGASSRPVGRGLRLVDTGRASGLLRHRAGVTASEAQTN